MEKIIKTIEKGLHDGFLKLYNKKLKETNIHVHQLYDFCLRRYFLAKKLNVNRIQQQKVNTPILMTRAIGIKIEEIAKEVLEASFKEKVIPKYNLSLSLYDDVCLTGEIDLIVGKYICEIKSMKPDSFDSIELPDRYIKQVQAYLALSKLLKTKIETKFGILISFCKLQKTPQFKIHTIEYNKAIEKSILDLKSNLIKYSKKKELPIKTCQSLHCYLAKNCHLRNECFKEE